MVKTPLPKIVIIDYGLGNLRSVHKALEKIGADVYISKQEEDISKADALILPGVGAFRDAVKNIVPLKSVVCEQVESEKPLLGICLGLQLLFTESTEGGIYDGLDVLRGRIVRFPEGLKVPHIGWNAMRIVDSANPLVEGLPKEPYVYFVHSYYAEVKDKSDIVALTDYGLDFPSMVAKGDVFATQFHPEKSGKVGLKILENFFKYIKR